VEGAAEVDQMLESVVVGTVLGGSALSALRRLAQAAESGRRYPPGVVESEGLAGVADPV
jgi:hypothetical protein